jgi:hypothetical protein
MFTVQTQIDTQRIADLLCTALEGGSNYWYTIAEFIKPDAFLFRMDEKQLFRHLDYPLNPGGALKIKDTQGDESVTYTLDLDVIQKGLKLWAEKYPSDYAQFLADNEDAETGDSFLQTCLFGEVVYG